MNSDLQKKLENAQDKIRELEGKVTTVNEELSKSKAIAEEQRVSHLEELKSLKKKHKSQLERLQKSKDFMKRKLARHLREMEDVKRDYEQTLRRKDGDYDQLRYAKKEELDVLVSKNKNLNHELKNVTEAIQHLLLFNVHNMTKVFDKKEEIDAFYRTDFSQRPLFIVDWAICKFNDNCEVYHTYLRKIKTENEEFKKKEKNREKERELNIYTKIQGFVTEKMVEEMRRNMEIIYKCYPKGDHVEYVRDTVMDFDFESYMELIGEGIKNIKEGRIVERGMDIDIFDDDFMATYKYVIEDRKFKEHQRMEESEAKNESSDWKVCLENSSAKLRGVICQNQETQMDRE